MVPISFALNVVHGFFGIIYYGATTVFGIAIAPRLAKLSSEAIRELMKGFLPSVLSFIESSGIVTIVFGAGQFLHYMIGYYKAGGMPEVESVLFSTGWGISILLGGIIGLFGFLVGLSVRKDINKLASVYRNILPDDAQVNEVKTNLMKVSLIGTTLLTISVILMLVGVTFLPLPEH
ncbi:hypothetical protein [Sulfuracidifex metallicus]|uniref:Uncharacterized protein n=1 Tax=Sulfuracidifex metallicus DSM 6482 = JCM 9184 TaxID=523847 RepID=A0A6A9QNU2_SULME|nr:hypothetical protein [Sulfuracidifex metallicus]MUN28955.1 hypothetical protein [Sulfuracidifex metallicus DSM 6482 = JCM 9184]WOE50540.1 hypothetical protein RQ359_002075 [Sulfuracidifex metallicus DSM 6482 = JCM 9184]